MRRVGPDQEYLSELYWAQRPKDGYTDEQPFRANGNDAQDPQVEFRDYPDPQRPPIITRLSQARPTEEDLDCGPILIGDNYDGDSTEDCEPANDDNGASE